LTGGDRGFSTITCNAAIQAYRSNFIILSPDRQKFEMGIAKTQPKWEDEFVFASQVSPRLFRLERSIPYFRIIHSSSRPKEAA
jgi:hypothetical protein